ncbi:hypothetical protein TNCV_1696181 [Trichonephila clavipes]|nr:hypothetical protein TNCV_1696181 [Trichonephila clavipes]
MDNGTTNTMCTNILFFLRYAVPSGAAVAEWYRYRTVACFVTGDPKKTMKKRKLNEDIILTASKYANDDDD